MVCTDLINGKDLPFDIRKLLRVAQRNLIRSQQHVHLEFLAGRSKFVRAYHIACRGGANVGDDVHVWCPCRKLGLPGCDGGEGDDDEERAILSHGVKEVGQEGHALDGLHRISCVQTNCFLRFEAQNAPCRDPSRLPESHSRPCSRGTRAS